MCRSAISGLVRLRPAPSVLLARVPGLAVVDLRLVKPRKPRAPGLMLLVMERHPPFRTWSPGSRPLRRFSSRYRAQPHHTRQLHPPHEQLLELRQVALAESENRPNSRSIPRSSAMGFCHAGSQEQHLGHRPFEAETRIRIRLGAPFLPDRRSRCREERPALILPSESWAPIGSDSRSSRVRSPEAGSATCALAHKGIAVR